MGFTHGTLVFYTGFYRKIDDSLCKIMAFTSGIIIEATLLLTYLLLTSQLW